MTAITAADVDDSTSDAQISDASSQVGDTISDFTSDNSNKLIEQTGNTKTVKSEGESGTLSDLQSDIGSATDSITLQKDYTSTSDEQPFVIAKDLTIEGNGKTITAVNGAFNISSGNTVSIKNLVFTGKNGVPAMIKVDGTLNLENVTFQDCFSSTYANAAVLNITANAVVTMDGCSINNTCSTKAAVGVAAGAKLDVKNSNFTDIVALNAPIGTYGNGANITVDNCYFYNSSRVNYGAAIYMDNSGYLTVNNTLIENCSAGTRGAIYTSAVTNIENTVVTGLNLTTSSAQYSRGSGLWIETSTANVYLKNNTFTNGQILKDEGIYTRNGYINSTVKVTVADNSFDEGETPVFVAFVTDDNGNKIGGGNVVFTTEDKTYTATLENGTASVTASNLALNNTYRVKAVYQRTPEEVQEITEGVITYGNVLPAMTNYTSMQEVINSQEAQAVVKLNNNITRAEGEEKVVIDKDLTINGAKLVIDASQGTVFEITNGSTVTINDLTITNAESANVINITNGNLILENVVIKDTTVTPEYAVGALIAVKPDSTLSLINSTIENISGPLIDANGTTGITDTTFRNINGGSANGEIYVRSNLTMSGSTVENCTAYSGFLYSAASLPAFKMNGKLVINNCTFVNNVITTGNAVVSVANNTEIYNSKFIGNKATRDSSYASAIGISGSSDQTVTMNVTSCYFENNTCEGDEGSTAIVGAHSIMNVTNSIFLRNDTKPFFSYSTPEYGAKAILNGNYWGTNNTLGDGAVVTEGQEYDDWEDEWITTQYDVTIDNWVVINTEVTQFEDNNMKYNVVTTASSMDTDGQTSELTQSLPNCLNVSYQATAGRFDSNTVTISNNVANNVFTSGLDASTVTVSVPNIEQTFELEAPEIDESNYFGLELMIDGTPDGETFTFTRDCTRGESENNVTIENRNIVIDGNGHTIDENNGRLFMIQNSNVTLKNLIIKNAGTTYNPSVLQIWTGNLVMENVTIVNSTASSSGGALVYISADSNATINGVTFENNTARFISNVGTTLINNSVVKNTNANTSSMIYWAFNNGPLTIENTVFDNNTGYSAGFAANTNSVLTMNNVTFTNNTISTTGNGIVLHSNGTLTINNSNFVENTKNDSGALKGLIYIRADTVIDNTLFEDNCLYSTSTSSYSTGQGMVYIDKSGTKLNVTNSAFINNIANNGSAIFNYYGIFNMSNSVIIGSPTDNLIYTDYSTSYANDNWWGANEVPRDQFRTTSSYKVITDSWVIMEAEASEVADDKTTITTTLNKVTNADGVVSDLTGSLPDGLRVTYDVLTGTLIDSTNLINGVSTATVETDDGSYTVNVTQAQESIKLSNEGPIIVTEDSYSKYFNEDGTAKPKVTVDSTVYISGELSNKAFIFDVPVTVTTYNQTQANLTNVKFVFNEGTSGSNISNIIINNKDYCEYVIYLDHVDDVTIENVTINQENTVADSTHSIGIIYGENITIKDSAITTIGKCLDIDYTSNSKVFTSSIYSLATKALIIDSNTITTKQNGEATDYGTIEGLDLRGDMTYDEDEYEYVGETFEDARIVNNVINTESECYTYGLVFNFAVEDCVVDNNTFNSYSTFYSNGIEAFNTSKVNITNNNINANSADFAYGIFLSGMVDWNTYETRLTDFIYVANNTIVCNSNVAYVVELYMASSNTFINNNLTANTNYSIGFAGSDSGENTISYNNIVLNNDMVQTEVPNYDSIGSYPAGVKLVRSGWGYPGSNVITFNNITVNADTDDVLYTVNLTDAESNTVTDNTLIGNNIVGSDSVFNEGEDNTIERNLPKSVNVTMDEIVGFIGQETILSVSVIDEDGEDVQDGIVTFTDAKGNLLGVANVENGFAAIGVTYNKTLETTITAEYANEYMTATAENNLTIRKAVTIITIDEFTATVGEEVTITARVVDVNDNPVTNGKVVFKVNGKTLKDGSGKVIYAKVVDGVATITYTVPEDWTDANITAVYSGSSKYEESQETAAINMTATTPALTIEPITDNITIGTQVTLKASVTGTSSPLNNGKVVFKLNGKTLKDESGKVIYAKVVNGVATLDYTFADVKAKVYTLSAVLISTEYERLEDSTEISFVN
ncbi:MAG: Ig-like domain repeat protein [Methanosphaera sp.]|nr:Ig-like domain repeat protein [Methanosphaera sp.]